MRLFRFAYSPYVHKVQAFLDLCGTPYTTVDVPYADRSVLLEVSPGYVHVPVLELAPGEVVQDSRRILEVLTARAPWSALVPEGQEAAAWAYHDWVDATLEEQLFRLATPGIRARFPTPNERALFTLVKERKYGAGCVERWKEEGEALLARGLALLAPTRVTLSRRSFLLGEAPTIADAALYGQIVMCEAGSPGVTAAFGAEVGAWLGRLRALGVGGGS